MMITHSLIKLTRESIKVGCQRKGRYFIKWHASACQLHQATHLLVAVGGIKSGHVSPLSGNITQKSTSSHPLKN